jgi:hypothetical protein
MFRRRKHVHLLDGDLARDDLLVHPLVAGIEAARMADHCDLARSLLHARNLLGVGQPIRERDLHLHVLARLEAGDRLAGVDLRGRGQDHGIDIGPRETLLELRRDVTDAEPRGDLLCRIERAADERDHLHTIDLGHGFEMLDAERAGTGERNLHGFSRMM